VLHLSTPGSIKSQLWGEGGGGLIYQTAFGCGKQPLTIYFLSMWPNFQDDEACSYCPLTSGTEILVHNDKIQEVTAAHGIRVL
jgi:hypothetical protein